MKVGNFPFPMQSLRNQYFHAFDAESFGKCKIEGRKLRISNVDTFNGDLMMYNKSCMN